MRRVKERTKKNIIRIVSGVLALAVIFGGAAGYNMRRQSDVTALGADISDNYLTNDRTTNKDNISAYKKIVVTDHKGTIDDPIHYGEWVNINFPTGIQAVADNTSEVSALTATMPFRITKVLRNAAAASGSEYSYQYFMNLYDAAEDKTALDNLEIIPYIIEFQCAIPDGYSEKISKLTTSSSGSLGFDIIDLSPLNFVLLDALGVETEFVGEVIAPSVIYSDGEIITGEWGALIRGDAAFGDPAALYMPVLSGYNNDVHFIGDDIYSNEVEPDETKD